MILLFEEHPYDKDTLLSKLGLSPDKLDDFLHCFDGLPTNVTDKKISFKFVGYYFCAKEPIKDVVYVMPRVFVHKDDNNDCKVFTSEKFAGYNPFDLIKLNFKDSIHNKSKEKPLKIDEYLFIYEMAIWIYKTIRRYAETKGKGDIIDGDLMRVVTAPGESTETVIDTIDALVKFYKDHHNLFTFIAINRRNGGAKVNWRKTISTQTAYIQDKTPFYTTFINKSRTINFDEDVVVMFLSVMNYLKNKYYFGPVDSSGYELLRPTDVERLITTGKGVRIMKKMKHKYFKDEFVRLCDMLRIFFMQAYDVKGQAQKSEMTIVKKYDRVFEHMIDCLIGDDLPKALKYMKSQDDGKNIDHIYGDLAFFGQDKNIYYIGDSKYYKEGSELGKTPVAKQYTYAKNIVQYSMNIFNKIEMNYAEDEGKANRKIKDEEINIEKNFFYRDELTEGYNVTPNFFIQGRVFTDRRVVSKTFHEEKDIQLDGKDNFRLSYQFPNRLFDRDTLMLQTYDINFLYLIAVYVGKCESESVKRKIHEMLRKNLMQVLNDRYNLYRLPSLTTEQHIDDFMYHHYRTVVGKVISFDIGKNERTLLIALDKKANAEHNKDITISDGYISINNRGTLYRYKIEDYNLTNNNANAHDTTRS